MKTMTCDPGMTPKAWRWDPLLLGRSVPPRATGVIVGFPSEHGTVTCLCKSDRRRPNLRGIHGNLLSMTDATEWPQTRHRAFAKGVSAEVVYGYSKSRETMRPQQRNSKPRLLYQAIPGRKFLHCPPRKGNGNTIPRDRLPIAARAWGVHPRAIESSLVGTLGSGEQIAFDGVVSCVLPSGIRTLWIPRSISGAVFWYARCGGARGH